MPALPTLEPSLSLRTMGSCGLHYISQHFPDLVLNSDVCAYVIVIITALSHHKTNEYLDKGLQNEHIIFLDYSIHSLIVHIETGSQLFITNKYVFLGLTKTTSKITKESS